MAIADVLELDVEYLFRDYKNRKKAHVVRGEDQNSLKLNGVDYRQMAFHPKTQENPSIEVIGIEIPPGNAKGDLEYGHIGREVGIILEGSGRTPLRRRNLQIEKRGYGDLFIGNSPHNCKYGKKYS